MCRVGAESRRVCQLKGAGADRRYYGVYKLPLAAQEYLRFKETGSGARIGWCLPADRSSAVLDDFARRWTRFTGKLEDTGWARKP